MNELRLLALIASLSLGAISASAQTVEKESAAPRDRVAATLRALRDQAEPDDLRLSERAEPLLVTLRDDIRRALEESLASAPVSSTPQDLTSRLQKVLGGTPPPEIENDSDKGVHLGTIPQVRAECPQGHPGILLVTCQYPTLCGTTTSLYVFRAGQAGWTLSWSREPGDHPSDDPGLENLEYQLSATRPDGTFYLSTSANPPWCTSCWSVLRWAIVRFRADGSCPELILEEAKGFYRCDDRNPHHLASTERGVAVVYQTHSSDLGLWGRQVRIHYAFDGAKVIPEPMQGLRPDETVDLWKDLGPERAALWSEPSSWDKLKGIHATLRELDFGTYTLAQEAKGDAGKVLVIFRTKPDEEKGEPGQVWFFTLTLRDGIYRLEAISQERPEGFAEDQPIQVAGDEEQEESAPEEAD